MLSIQHKLAALIYACISLACLAMGVIYLMSPTFMPYHATAVGREWEDLEPSLQTLLLALLRVSGAGFLCVGLALAVLLIFPFRRQQRWATWAIPLIGLTYWSLVLYATMLVTLNTPATPPWPGSVAILAGLIAGFLLTFRHSSADNQSGPSA